MKIAILLLIVLLASSQVTRVQVGNSWPERIVVNTKEGLIYVASISGEYPLNGFFLTTIESSSLKIVKNETLNFEPSLLYYDTSLGKLLLVNANKIYEYSNLKVPLFVANETIYSLVDLGKGTFAVGLQDKIIETNFTSSSKIADCSYSALFYNGTSLFASCMTDQKIVLFSNGFIKSYLVHGYFPSDLVSYGGSVYFSSGSELLKVDKNGISLLHNFGSEIQKIMLDGKNIYVAAGNNVYSYSLQDGRTELLFTASSAVADIESYKDYLYVASYHFLYSVSFPSFQYTQLLLYLVIIFMFTLFFFIYRYSRPSVKCRVLSSY